jgi:hypothetical protein
MRNCLWAAAPLILLAAAAAAETSAFDGFMTKFMGRPLAPGGNYACFARVYDAAHLKAHPHQNVRDMALLVRVDSKNPTYLALTLGLHLRKRDEFRMTGDDCSAVGEGTESPATVRCSAPCEGGSVGIKLKDDGSALLDFPDNGSIWIESEPGNPVVKPSGLGGDDRLFRLDRAAGAACMKLASDKDEEAALARLR